MPISLSKRIGPDSFSVVWGSLHLLHNEPVTFPALPVPIYTPGWRGVIMVKCLTQGHNTLTIAGLEPTTFCLWIQHWSARPHASTSYYPQKYMSGTPLKCQKCWGFRGLCPLTPTKGLCPVDPHRGLHPLDPPQIKKKWCPWLLSFLGEQGR